ncbi:hypothetical protein [Rhodococcus daqingensis]|uniref:Uncharacterized protein n=1 Tax=Rhodococcus daqingensis TaxID=2479363 RepID=A0ABW2RUL7_9NOCA
MPHSQTDIRPPMARRFVVGVGSAVAAGVLVGIMSRLLMRLTTLAAGGSAGFSWSGTAGIVALYVAAMIPGALLVATTGARRSWWLLAAGAVFLCFPAIGVASEEVGYLGDLSVVRLLAVAVSGAAVFATLALLPLLTLRLVRRSA